MLDLSFVHGDTPFLQVHRLLEVYLSPKQRTNIAADLYKEVIIMSPKRSVFVGLGQGSRFWLRFRASKGLLFMSIDLLPYRAFLS